MALTESSAFPLQSVAPSFELLNTVTGHYQKLKDLKGEKGTVILFICNHCPYVIHINKILVQVANTYQSKGIDFIAISSNDIERYPMDGPEFMKEAALLLKYPFPYLYDETQEIAKVYHAACTPDIYLFDDELKSVYHGQFDDSRPGNNVPVSGENLIEAMDALLKSKRILKDQKPSIGCGIKWR
jgi:thiol-disulfide isomerase/thioredoxin